MTAPPSLGLEPEVLVVGDILMDRDVSGSADRLAPDAPVPVVAESDTVSRPGGAGLAACLGAQAGLSVALVTRLGIGSVAEELLELCSDRGVAVLGPSDTAPVPEKIRVIARGQTLLRLDRHAQDTREGDPSFDEESLELVRSARVVVVSDYGRGVTKSPEIRRALAERRRPTLWDPHARGGAPVAGTCLVTPNRAELLQLFPATGTGMKALVESMAAARRAWSVPAVAATLGEHGALCLDSSGPPLAIPALPIGPVDSCGAGDRFIMAVAKAICDGAVISEAVSEAVSVTGSWLEAGGVATLERATAVEQIHDRLDSDAVLLADRAHARGESVVVAGGCFDLLHAGHVALLESARRLGDCLIVALNSDRSVRRLKGEGRPIMPEQDRAALLRALSCVDGVAIFEEDSPLRLLDRIRPEVFVKGGDYGSQALEEEPLVRTWGGQAVVVPYLSGRSSTRLAMARPNGWADD